MEWDARDIQSLGECLRAIAFGRFIDNDDFDCVFELEREEIARIASAWPDVDMSDNTVQTAIKDSLNNLIGYPISHLKDWPLYLSIERKELALSSTDGAIP